MCKDCRRHDEHCFRDRQAESESKASNGLIFIEKHFSTRLSKMWSITWFLFVALCNRSGWSIVALNCSRQWERLPVEMSHAGGFEVNSRGFRKFNCTESWEEKLHERLSSTCNNDLVASWTWLRLRNGTFQGWIDSTYVIVFRGFLFWLILRSLRLRLRLSFRLLILNLLEKESL